MPGPLGPIIAGVAGLAGSIFGSSSSASSAESAAEASRYATDQAVASQTATNVSNAEQAHQNRLFQERMRNTQYTTQVDDMRRAGLNPAVMMQGGGSGAGVPGGSMIPAQSSAAALSAGGGQVASAKSAAGIARAKMIAEMATVSANTAKSVMESKKIDKETTLIPDMKKKIIADTNSAETSALLNVELGKKAIVARKHDSILSKMDEWRMPRASDRMKSERAGKIGKADPWVEMMLNFLRLGKGKK